MSGGEWLQALDDIKCASAVSMALVTEINSLVYIPTSTFTVCVANSASALFVLLFDLVCVLNVQVCCVLQRVSVGVCL